MNTCYSLRFGQYMKVKEQNKKILPNPMDIHIIKLYVCIAFFALLHYFFQVKKPYHYI